MAKCLFNYALLFIETDVEMAREYMQKAKGIAEKYAERVSDCAEICKKIVEKLSADD